MTPASIAPTAALRGGNPLNWRSPVPALTEFDLTDPVARLVAADAVAESGDLLRERILRSQWEIELDGDTLVVTGPDAIEAFDEFHDGGLVAVTTKNGSNWSDYHATQEHYRELLADARSLAEQDGDEFAADARFDGETLCVSGYEFALAPVTGYEGKAVACRGAHYGLEWGASCDEIDSYHLSVDLQSRELLDLIWARTEEIGLSEIDDPTDDGSNFVVADEAKFLAYARAVQSLTAVIECDTDELFAFAGRLIAGESIEALLSECE